MNDRAESLLWVEKYRPKKIQDCILPAEIKKTFSELVTKGEVPNLILTGSAGTGKTTVARALCTELGFDVLFINASEESGIDVLRNKIQQFASTVGFSDKTKVVLLDEADYLNPNSTQPALRGFIEEFHQSSRFILTCNFKNKIIEPLHSRCSIIDFRIPNGEKPKLGLELFRRLEYILKAEGITYDKKVLGELISKFFPDFRRCLNELQRYSVSGTIDAGILSTLSDVKMSELIKFLKGKEFTNVRRWVVENLDGDTVRVYRAIYDALYDNVDTSSIPAAVVILGEWQYKTTYSADKELAVMACLTQLMMQLKFKG